MPANRPAARLAKRAARKLAGPQLVQWRRRRLVPDLSIVMPVYNVETYLREALDSALTQSLHNVELIAVDDGSSDGCLAILREYEARDYRVRVFTQANAGQGIARNVGVAHARAEFLTFMDSDDTIPPGAFEHMVTQLRSSGSDFCVGGVRRFRNRQYLKTSWQRTVHQTDRIGVTLEEFPAAMQDIIACNRVFRTDFWRDRVGDFRGRIAYEDHVPMLAAYVRAQKFDVLSMVTYNWRIREDSTGQRKAQLQNLLDRIEVKAEAHEMLRAEASDLVYDAWVARCLEVDFGPFVTMAIDADDEYRDALVETYRLFTGRATERAWDLVRVNPKVRAHLVAANRWADVEEANQWWISVHQVPPTTVVDASDGTPVLTAVLPDAPWARDLPAHLLRMAALESHFEGAIQHVRWLEDGATLEITGWMRHRGLDITSPRPALNLVLRPTGTEHEDLELTFTPEVLPEANLWSPLPYAGCANAGFRAQIPVADLTPGITWALHGSITESGITSAGMFHYPVRNASGQDPQPRTVLLDGEPVGVRPRWDPQVGFSIRTKAGGLKKQPAAPVGPAVAAVGVTDQEITVSFVGDVPAEIALGNSRTRLTLLGAEGSTARFATQVTEFGSGPHVAPSADYVLTVAGQPVSAEADFAANLPLRLATSTFRLAVTSGKKNALKLTLTPPLADSELGRAGQFRLYSSYWATTAAIRPETFLLATYLGEFAADSQLAIDRYLAEHRPEIDRIWGIKDFSTLTPPGARRVLMESAEWYDAVATSRYLSKNIDFGPWFRGRPEQAYLQTFHGYPFKSMGIDFWKSRSKTPAQIRYEIAKANREWDLILVPSAECEAYYREQFHYEGPVLVAGYPRTDVLVNADSAATRTRVLEKIGVPEDKTVVLYAPTYRDTLTTRLYAATRFDELDLSALTDSLGEEYVVLVRGHNNNQREDERVPRAGSVVDVTDYPDINELTLAADIAVLDYSSLRFDWALTGKPMVFFVPDRESYFERRPPLFSFEESAPGPWARTTSEVAAALGDLDGLRVSTADAIAAFNQRFNGLHDGRSTERVLTTLLDESMPWRQG